ncbi:unnamed protein product [Clavelina lepadiformis]|uniref:Uncharacterized protein n=1 Tax=Clavelina lepadiformis TaxID=159417 RepID=A0ABP0FXJ0_CLALP
MRRPLTDAADFEKFSSFLRPQHLHKINDFSNTLSYGLKERIGPGRNFHVRSFTGSASGFLDCKMLMEITNVMIRATRINNVPIAKM